MAPVVAAVGGGGEQDSTNKQVFSLDGASVLGQLLNE